MAVGWLEPVEVTAPTAVIQLRPVAEGGDAYIIYNSGNRNEYYILENRQQRGWDACLGGHGLVITHVDYDASAWAGNKVNTSSRHQRVSIVCADNRADAESLGGDPFPGTFGNTSFTDTSTPSASLFNTNADGTMLLGMPVERIVESADGLITMSIGGAELPVAPAGLMTTDITSTGFAASWNQLAMADAYDVAIMKDYGTSMQLATETFDKLTGSSDGSADLSSKLDNYTAASGWTGTKVYRGAQGVKIGTSKGGGSISSPILTSGNTAGIVRVTLTATEYGDDSNHIRIAIVDTDDTEIAAYDLTIDGTETTVALPRLAAASYKVKLTPEKRAYVKNLTVTDLPSTGMVESISETTKTFDGLTADTPYLWWVRGIIDGIAQCYSAPVATRTSTTDAIEEVTDGGDGESMIYSISGTRIGTCGDAGLKKLPRGTYIIKSSKGTRKIIYNH